MSRVFVIAEAACTWLHGGLEAAFRSIQAAKDCDADAWKTQWTSDYRAMHKRRGIGGDHYKRLSWPREWLPKLKAECDRVGIEFMCTVFIPEDLRSIALYVNRFKLSAFEWRAREEFVSYTRGNPFESLPWIASVNPGRDVGWRQPNWKYLHCVSQYPTRESDLVLSAVGGMDGLSDHTTSTLTGAVAVGAGARILEHHFRLDDTPETDPDFPHSFEPARLKVYISNVREAEVML